MRWLKLVMRWLLGIVFIGAGTNHFINSDFYVRMMPPYLPWHLELVYLSGIIEIVLGLLILVPRCSRLAAWGMFALMIAVLPANIHMAMNPHEWPRLDPVGLYLRVPMQALLLAWAYWFTLKEDSKEQEPEASATDKRE